MSLVNAYSNPTASAFLQDPKVYEILEGIAQRYGLPLARSEEFLDLVEAVMDEVIDFIQMPDLLAEAFSLDLGRANNLAADIAGERLLLFEYYLPGLAKQIINWGGKIENYPALRIERGQEFQLSAMNDILAEQKISLTEPMLKRLLFLLDQYTKKEKSEEGLKTYFSRSVNIGGLGLTVEQATLLLAEVLPKITSLVALESAVPTDPLDVVREEPVQAQKSVAKQELELVPSHALAAEVPVISRPISPAVSKGPLAPTNVQAEQLDLIVPAKQAAVARQFTAGTEGILASALKLATTQASSVLQARKISEKVFVDLVGKAIKGLRDIYQTRDMVERDWKIKGQELAQIMEAISAGIEAYQRSSASAPSKPSVRRSTPDSAVALDQRFEKLTAAATVDSVEPVRTELTVGSAPTTMPTGQRKMVDVIRPMRLAGPIEQLGKMTPTEFRRLSSNAADAGQKVQDLLVALESTAYEERVKGVLAWRASPINQLYLHIAEEALVQGLALPEVSSRRRSAGHDSLSPGEMKALALLNAQIRF